MHQLTRLLDIMSALRNPESGCPWDLQQDYKSLVPYTLEEAYEVAEAIELGDMNEVKKELGDLLFQVVFYAQLAREEGLFDFDDIAGTIADKMVSRHPHVFSDHKYENEEAFLKAWEQQKEAEKNQAMAENSAKIAPQDGPDSLMNGISKVLPAMTRAVKIQKRASHIGFDWNGAVEVLPKIREELNEFEEALIDYREAGYQGERGKEQGDSTNTLEQVEGELGDILFSCVNIARKLKIDPEKALRLSNHKFSQRFRKLEQHYQHDRQRMEQESLENLESVWQSIKTTPLPES